MTELKDYRITQEFRLWASATVEAESLQDAVRKVVERDVIDWDYETGDSEPISDITVHPPDRDEPEVEAKKYARDNNIVVQTCARCKKDIRMNDEMTEQRQRAYPHSSTFIHTDPRDCTASSAHTQRYGNPSKTDGSPQFATADC